MITTVDDLLVLARADERGLTLMPVLVDLRDLARRAVQQLGPLAHRRDVDLTVDGPSVTACADPMRLDQALRNLIDNAIKFGPSGGRVTVRTWRTPHEAGVTVEDDGPGIPQGLADRVFDRFFRVDPSRSRASGGSGLGLAIARELVVAHGGRVAVTPRRPHGSAFTITLPIA